MAQTLILFPTDTAANGLVAGLPAAVRTALRVIENGGTIEADAIAIAVPGGWSPSPSTRAEFERLVPGKLVEPIDALSLEELEQASGFDGLELLCRNSLPLRGPVTAILNSPDFTDPERTKYRLAQSSKAIVKGTQKAIDGFVSRTINRPISQFCSLHLLKPGWVRPNHATFACWALALIMALFLFAGGELGLYTGAILFQIISILDGVDGEIARATLRSSKLGALLDTIGDVITNFVFVIGLAFNTWQSGDAITSATWLIGLAILATGLAILGVVSRRRGGSFSFEVLKDDNRVLSSPVLKRLAKIASRDFYAFAIAFGVLVGIIHVAAIVFAGAMAIWLVVVVAVLLRPPLQS